MSTEETHIAGGDQQVVLCLSCGCVSNFVFPGMSCVLFGDFLYYFAHAVLLFQAYSACNFAFIPAGRR